MISSVIGHIYTKYEWVCVSQIRLTHLENVALDMLGKWCPIHELILWAPPKQQIKIH